MLFLQRDETIAENASTSLLTLNADLPTFKDMAIMGNPVNVSIPTSGSFIEDRFAPVLLNFTLDMTTQILAMTFGEIVRGGAGINTSLLRLQDQANVPVYFVDLSGWEVLTQTNEFIISVFTNFNQNLNAIKDLLNLATADSNTYLRLFQGAVTDMNMNVNLNMSSALRTSAFKEDLVRPYLLAWALNMNTLQMIFTFDETIDHTSLMLSNNAVRIQSHSTGSLDFAFSFNGTTDTYFDNIVIVNFTLADSYVLKATGLVALSPLASYLVIQSNAIFDMNKNPVNAINSTAGLQVSAYTYDTTKPILTGWSLDMNATFMTLTFSEPVLTTTVRCTQFTLYSALSAGVTYQLTGNRTVILDGARGTL
jgi:hypothetical protein